MRSSSQPDLTLGGGWWALGGAGGGGESRGLVSVIRVWRSLGPEAKDQVSKLVALHPRTTARAAVRLAAIEFNIDLEDAATEFCLCLVRTSPLPHRLTFPPATLVYFVIKC